MTGRETTDASCSTMCSMAGIPTRCHVTISSACPDELDSEAADLLIGVLEDAERLTLRSFKDDDARRQYLVGHVLMRTSLSALCSVMPSEWRFGRTPLGQPIIIRPQGAAPLFFSLSHTSSLAVCAVSSTLRVGVDTERVETSLDTAELVPHVLSEDEREWWQREGPRARLRRFLQVWTLKESFLKAVGLGLQLQPSRLSFRLSGGMPPELRQLPIELGRCEDWSFRVFDPTQVHVCALAVGVQPERPLSVCWHCMSIKDLIGCAHRACTAHGTRDVIPSRTSRMRRPP